MHPRRRLKLVAQRTPLTDPPHRNTGAVILDNCKYVEIDDLTVNDQRPETIAGVHIKANVWPGETGVTWTGLNMTINGGSVPVLDERPPETRARGEWTGYR